MYTAKERFEGQVSFEKKKAKALKRDPQIENHICPVCGKEYERMKGNSMACCSKECWDVFSKKEK